MFHSVHQAERIHRTYNILMCYILLHSKFVVEALFQLGEDELGQYSEEEGADNSHVSH